MSTSTHLSNLPTAERPNHAMHNAHGFIASVRHKTQDNNTSFLTTGRSTVVNQIDESLGRSRTSHGHTIVVGIMNAIISDVHVSLLLGLIVLTMASSVLKPLVLAPVLYV